MPSTGRAISRNLVQGGSRVLDSACYPTQFGCEQAGMTRYDYDPAAARKLLAEAGHPDGFETELVSYVLPQYSLAIQTYLKAVGINARLSQLPTGDAVARSIAGQNPLYAGSWGSYSVNDVSAILPFFFGGGGDDYARDPVGDENWCSRVAPRPIRTNAGSCTARPCAASPNRCIGCRSIPM